MFAVLFAQAVYDHRADPDPWQDFRCKFSGFKGLEGTSDSQTYATHRMKVSGNRNQNTFCKIYFSVALGVVSSQCTCVRQFHFGSVAMLPRHPHVTVQII